MPTAIDESIRACCADAVSQAVVALAAKYGFDADEAERELNLGELKLQRKTIAVYEDRLTKVMANEVKLKKAATAEQLVCQICGKMFASPAYLSSHMARRHTMFPGAAAVESCRGGRATSPPPPPPRTPTPPAPRPPFLQSL